jgi:membrane protein YdbS with pleckstrin-like domain
LSATEIVIAIIGSLLVNETCDLSPWIARKLVRWSAHLRYTDAGRAQLRADELAAVIDERPGKLLKLTTALGFAAAAGTVRLRRAIADRVSIVHTTAAQVQQALRGDLTSYLEGSERLHGHWRRHPIHFAKELAVSVTTTFVLGYLSGKLQSHGALVVFLMVAIWMLIMGWVGWRIAVWHSERFILTDRRLVLVTGIARRSATAIPLLRVVDLRFTQSPAGRALNYGHFEVEPLGPWPPDALRHIRKLPNPHLLFLFIADTLYGHGEEIPGDDNGRRRHRPRHRGQTERRHQVWPTRRPAPDPNGH